MAWYTYRRCLATPPLLPSSPQCVHDDHRNVAGQRCQHAHGHPLEQQLAGLAEIQLVWCTRLFLVLLRQRLASRPQLLRLRRTVTLITSADDAPDGEGDNVKAQENYRVGNLKVGEYMLCYWIGNPREWK